MMGIFSWWFEHVFTLKSLLERKNCDFDDSKIDLRREYLVGGLSMFLRWNRF